MKCAEMKERKISKVIRQEEKMLISSDNENICAYLSHPLL